MKNLLILNYRNCISSKKFKFCFFILFTIVIMAFLNIAFVNFGNNSLSIDSTYKMGLILGWDSRSFFHLFNMIAPLVVAFMYSDSFIEERENNIYPMIVARSEKNKYFISKGIVVFTVAFFSVFSILAIGEILTYIAIPNIGVNNQTGIPYYVIIPNTEPEYFLQEIMDKYPYIYSFILIAMNALFTAIISLMTYSISLIVKLNKIVVLVGVFLFVNMMAIIVPMEYEMNLYLQSWPGKVNDYLFTLSIWSIITLSLFIIGIRKEKI